MLQNQVIATSSNVQAVSVAPAVLSGIAQATSLKLERTLFIGTRGDDVVALQRFLIQQGHLASGNDIGYFGPLTRGAVQSFQKTHGIIFSGPAYGIVGPLTRAKIFEITSK